PPTASSAHSHTFPTRRSSDLTNGATRSTATPTTDESDSANQPPAAPDQTWGSSLLDRGHPADPASIRHLPIGLWRSLVARLTGGQEVVGSNPASPTPHGAHSLASLDPWWPYPPRWCSRPYLSHVRFSISVVPALGARRPERRPIGGSK